MGPSKRRPGWDAVWFGAALALLVAGVVGWWSSGPAATLYPFGAGAQMIAVWASGAIVLFAWWRRSSAPDAFDAPLMGPLALAASGPLSLLSVSQLSPVPAVTAGVLAGLVALPLGWCLADRILDARTRERTCWVAVACAVPAAVLGQRLADGGGADAWQVARWALASASALVPAVVLGSTVLRGQDGHRSSAARRMIGALAIVSMGVAPAVTGLCLLIDEWPLLVLPAVAVVVTLIVLTRFALQPLAVMAGAAQTQRDRVVAAADAERARLASVLHDGPLADITLLIQRLDLQGDGASAAIARSIAGELRSIGSELRLPVLDDLGTGPALEWLVARLAARSGATIRLDQRTLVRPPGEVEFAMYRVAQEAIVNALTHGRPPIDVRYSATLEGARLLVADAGPGIDRDARATAEHDGRLGLASMLQRAEAVGARLELGTGSAGGGRVTMAWRAMPVPSPGDRRSATETARPAASVVT